jgi:hypothetical protein
MTQTHDGRSGGTPAVLPRAITHRQLVRDWRTTLDAFGVALDHEGRYYTPSELKQLERHLADDRRWLAHFAAIRDFPDAPVCTTHDDASSRERR